MKQHKVIYPFHKGKRDLYDKEADAVISKETWEAGVRWVQYDEYQGVAESDGMGFMILEEVGRYTPKGYRQRVFYTRQFIDPDGKEFGKKGLRMAGAEKFKRMCQGYAYSHVCSADNKEYPRYATKPYGDEQ